MLQHSFDTSIGKHYLDVKSYIDYIHGHVFCVDTKDEANETSLSVLGVNIYWSYYGRDLLNRVRRRE